GIRQREEDAPRDVLLFTQRTCTTMSQARLPRVGACRPSGPAPGCGTHRDRDFGPPARPAPTRRRPTGGTLMSFTSPGARPGHWGTLLACAAVLLSACAERAPAPQANPAGPHAAFEQFE